MPDIVIGPPGTTAAPQTQIQIGPPPVRIQIGPPPQVNFGQTGQPEPPIREIPPPPPRGVAGTITDYLREFWNGFTLDLWQHAEAGLSQVVAPIMGETPQTLPQIAGERQDFMDRSPVAANLARGAGAAAWVPLTMGAAAAHPAATAALSGASLPARVGLGLGTGAAASGIQAMAAPGEGTLAERAQGALPYMAWGAVAGAVLPTVLPAMVSAVPAAARFLGDAVTPGGNFRRISSEIGQSPATVAARMAENPNLTAADIHPQFAHAARELGSPAITNRFAARQAAVPDMVRQVVADTIGIRPDIALAQQTLRDTASANLNRVIQPMLDTAARVNVAPVLQLMNRLLPPNSAEWRAVDNLLRPQGGYVMTDADTLFDVQAEIRRMAERYKASGNPADHTVGGQLFRLREQLLTQLDLAAGAVPNTGAGPLRIALSQFKDEMDVDREFMAALRNTLYNPGSRQAENMIEQTPEQFQRWVQGLDPTGLEAARLGATSAYQNLMDGTMAGAASVMRASEVLNNRLRLAALFGDEAANAMMEGLDRIRGMQSVNTQVAGAAGVGTPSAAVRTATAAPEHISGIRAPAAAGAGAMVFGGPLAGVLAAGGTATAQGISRAASGSWARRRQAALGNLLATPGTPGQQAIAAIARRPILPPSDMWPVLPFIPQAVEAAHGD